MGTSQDNQQLVLLQRLISKTLKEKVYPLMQMKQFKKQGIA